MQPDSSPRSSPCSPPPTSRAPRRLSPVPLHLDLAARTHTGLERSGNEDSLLVTSFGSPGRMSPHTGRVDVGETGWAALAVCDGMGGAAGGEVASRAAVEVIQEVMARGGALTSRDELCRRLVDSVEEASRRVHAFSLAEPSLHGMGTTATVCALRDETLFIAQVGDSRAYLLRNGHLTQLTRDQTLAAMLVERGQLAAEDMPGFALGHVILQAVGTTERIEVDLSRVTVRRDDVLLICSDGLSGPVSHEAIRQVLERAQTPSEAGETLIELANAAGGPDNITAIVARIGGDMLGPPSDPARLDHAASEDEDPTPPAPTPTPPEPEDDDDTLVSARGYEPMFSLRRR